jgi:hypothetical protein
VRGEPELRFWGVLSKAGRGRSGSPKGKNDRNRKGKAGKLERVERKNRKGKAKKPERVEKAGTLSAVEASALQPRRLGCGSHVPILGTPGVEAAGAQGSRVWVAKPSTERHTILRDESS